MAEAVRYEVRDGVAVITIDNPPVNALGPGVAEAIEAAVARAAADPDAEAAVITGAGTTFIAGADIRIFGTITDRRSVHRALPHHARPAAPHRRLPQARRGGHSRHRARRRHGGGDGLPLPGGRAGCAGGAAGSDAGHHPRRGRHAAPAAPGGSGGGARVVHRRHATFPPRRRWPRAPSTTSPRATCWPPPSPSCAASPCARRANGTRSWPRATMPWPPARRPAPALARTGRGARAPFAAVDAIEAASRCDFDAGSRARNRAVRRLRALGRIPQHDPAVLRRARGRAKIPDVAAARRAARYPRAPRWSGRAPWAAASPWSTPTPASR